MKIHRMRNGVIRLSFKSTPSDQASVHNLFNSLLGRPEAETCKECGGVVSSDTAHVGALCKCKKEGVPS